MFGRSADVNPDSEFFVVYDSKTDSYDLPSFAINEHDMVRAICNLFSSRDAAGHRYFQNAEDFQLFSIGKFWKKTARAEMTAPRHIANLHELKSLVVNQQSGIAAT